MYFSCLQCWATLAKMVHAKDTWGLDEFLRGNSPLASTTPSAEEGTVETAVVFPPPPAIVELPGFFNLCLCAFPGRLGNNTAAIALRASFPRRGHDGADAGNESQVAPPVPKHVEVAKREAGCFVRVLVQSPGRPETGEFQLLPRLHGL